MSELQDILDTKLGVKGMNIIHNLISRPISRDLFCVIFKGFNYTNEHQLIATQIIVSMETI